MEFTQDEVVSQTIGLANGGDLPDFLERLPGAPSRLVPLRIPFGSLINRETGEPATPPDRDMVVNVDRDALIETLRQKLRMDLDLIANGDLSRKRRKEIATEASRVTMRIRGDQRRLRPAYLEIPDMDAAIGYVLHIMASPRSGEQLARCKLNDCPNFFLRELRQARPECYCCPAHAKSGKRAATADRGRKFRIREKAIKQLQKRYPTSARRMIGAIDQGEHTAKELVQLAEAKSTKPGRHK